VVENPRSAANVANLEIVEEEQMAGHVVRPHAPISHKVWQWKCTDILSLFHLQHQVDNDARFFVLETTNCQLPAASRSTRGTEGIERYMIVILFYPLHDGFKVRVKLICIGLVPNHASP
jgi:hypothetical protein